MSKRSHFRTSGLRAVLPTVFLLFWALPSSADESPWQLLDGLRQALEAQGPVTGKFQQTYIPAGFSTGDAESGHLSLWLPRCLRWNYEEPQDKSFLLCDDEVYFWNADDPGGRHYRIQPEQEPGLDLLLVDVARLKERYTAESLKLDDGTYQVALALPPEVEGRFSAKIHIDPVAQRILGLEYTDEEGNLTRFTVGDYQKLAHTALFQPPANVEWTEE